MKKNRFIFLLIPFALMINSVAAQKDSVVATEVVKLKYFNDNNSVQYLLVESLLKTGKKTEPLQNKSFQIFLDSNAAANLIGVVTTDKKGKAKSFLPPSLKTAWESAPLHKFIAVPVGKEEEPAAELEITKAKIKIDTAWEEGVRSIMVQVMKYEKSEWIPVKDVEMKLGIRRHGGILSAGDEETYTTDSTGTVTAEFKKEKLPGDEKGNIVITAKVEENEQLGNLLIEQAVPWGVAVKADNSFFNQRTLWSTRFRTPFWLLFMAYSIVIGVWGTIIYLVFQIIKIKKLGAGNISTDPVIQDHS